MLPTLLVLLLGQLCVSSPASPPDDFPRFVVPGHEKEMDILRELFWLHYPGAGPKATLWDEWLPDASLWPAVHTDSQSEAMLQQWSKTLSSRVLDPEGYVATHQHASIAHQLGWPFPFWTQGRRGCGWHFSFKNTAGPGWRPNDLSRPDGWSLTSARDAGVTEDGWRLDITNAAASLVAPPWKCATFEVPFLQLRWQMQGLSNCQPCVEWTTPTVTNFNPARRLYFAPPADDQMAYTMIPMYRHPLWTGEVAQLRLNLANQSSGLLTVQAFFSQYDTRHNINNQNFIRGCAKYFWWSRDLNFLRANIQRLRTALLHLMTEQHALQRKVIHTTWIGHEGRSGLQRSPDGKKEIFTGRGIGNNYWDILPFGNLDCYATIQYYDALRTLAALERDIRSHPEWNIPLGPLPRGAEPSTFDFLNPSFLEAHAADVKTEGNKRFWNPETGRFVACIDADGKVHDYGFTFLNCDAIYYDFATPAHARDIMTWLDGARTIPGDTAQGADIYHWRFGPRATTRRNLDWYFWAWNNPEHIPWGGQVQDGGAVLGFSYHDLMARLRILGPDNARNRLREILRWFDEVRAAGGYRAYYNGTREGSLQGGGTAGGLGVDKEFFESALVPQVMLNGFLGFAPRADGLKLHPRLPAGWPELRVDRIRFQGSVLSIQATRGGIEIRRADPSPVSEPWFLRLPPGRWQATLLASDGSPIREEELRRRQTDGALELRWGRAATVRLAITNVPAIEAPGERQAFFRARPSKPGEFRATWIHSAYGVEGWTWDRTVATLKSNGFNAIIPNLLWAGLAHYPSKVLPASARASEQGDQIAECLAACRKYGIQMHVWKVNHNLLHAPPDFRAALRSAARTQKDFKGQDIDWLCPSHPENLALERDSMLEVVRNYDVDGIHFDYIRYPNKDACYCDGCRSRFERATGVKIRQWPEDVLSGDYSAQFADWRREQITRLVRAVSRGARTIRPAIKVSAAVFGDWTSCRRSVAQDWKAWIEAGYLDFVCPMDYEADDETFAKLVRSQVGWVGHKTPLYTGIGAHKLSGPEQLVRQIQLNRDLGADGFVVFNLTEKLATQFLPALRLGATSAPPLGAK